jgi:hypothetical protein
MFDYKSYQMRHANASTLEEKMAINQELKDLYNTFSEEEKKAFDKGLEDFLRKEKNNLESHYQAIMNQNLN